MAHRWRCRPTTCADCGARCSVPLVRMLPKRCVYRSTWLGFGLLGFGFAFGFGFGFGLGVRVWVRG